MKTIVCPSIVLVTFPLPLHTAQWCLPGFPLLFLMLSTSSFHCLGYLSPSTSHFTMVFARVPVAVPHAIYIFLPLSWLPFPFHFTLHNGVCQGSRCCSSCYLHLPSIVLVTFPLPLHTSQWCLPGFPLLFLMLSTSSFHCLGYLSPSTSHFTMVFARVPVAVPHAIYMFLPLSWLPFPFHFTLHNGVCQGSRCCYSCYLHLPSIVLVTFPLPLHTSQWCLPGFPLLFLMLSTSSFHCLGYLSPSTSHFTMVFARVPVAVPHAIYIFLPLSWLPFPFHFTLHNGVCQGSRCCYSCYLHLPSIVLVASSPSTSHFTMVFARVPVAVTHAIYIFLPLSWWPLPLPLHTSQWCLPGFPLLLLMLSTSSFHCLDGLFPFHFILHNGVCQGSRCCSSCYLHLPSIVWVTFPLPLHTSQWCLPGFPLLLLMLSTSSFHCLGYLSPSTSYFTMVFARVPVAVTHAIYIFLPLSWLPFPFHFILHNGVCQGSRCCYSCYLHLPSIVLVTFPLPLHTSQWCLPGFPLLLLMLSTSSFHCLGGLFPFHFILHNGVCQGSRCCYSCYLHLPSIVLMASSPSTSYFTMVFARVPVAVPHAIYIFLPLSWLPFPFHFTLHNGVCQGSRCCYSCYLHLPSIVLVTFPLPLHTSQWCLPGFPLLFLMLSTSSFHCLGYLSPSTSYFTMVFARVPVAVTHAIYIFLPLSWLPFPFHFILHNGVCQGSRCCYSCYLHLPSIVLVTFPLPLHTSQWCLPGFPLLLLMLSTSSFHCLDGLFPFHFTLHNGVCQGSRCCYSCYLHLPSIVLVTFPLPLHTAQWCLPGFPLLLLMLSTSSFHCLGYLSPSTSHFTMVFARVPVAVTHAIYIFLPLSWWPLPLPLHTSQWCLPGFPLLFLMLSTSSFHCLGGLFPFHFILHNGVCQGSRCCSSCYLHLPSIVLVTFPLPLHTSQWCLPGFPLLLLMLSTSSFHCLGGLFPFHFTLHNGVCQGSRCCSSWCLYCFQQCVTLPNVLLHHFILYQLLPMCLQGKAVIEHCIYTTTDVLAGQGRY